MHEFGPGSRAEFCVLSLWRTMMGTYQTPGWVLVETRQPPTPSRVGCTQRSPPALRQACSGLRYSLSKVLVPPAQVLPLAKGDELPEATETAVETTEGGLVRSVAERTRVRKQHQPRQVALPKVVLPNASANVADGQADAPQDQVVYLVRVHDVVRVVSLVCVQDVVLVWLTPNKPQLGQ